MHIISVHSYERVCACACASERVSARSRGVKTQKKRETSGWSDRGRVEERTLRRASAEKEKFTIEYTFRHPLLKRKLVVLGDVTVCCLSLVDPGHIFSKFYY